jgi:hypothetical protein
MPSADKTLSGFVGVKPEAISDRKPPEKFCPDLRTAINYCSAGHAGAEMAVE